jgi:hypothetical protein
MERLHPVISLKRKQDGMERCARIMPENAAAPDNIDKNSSTHPLNDSQENPINKPTEIERRYNYILLTFKGLIPILSRQKENSYQN